MKTIPLGSTGLTVTKTAMGCLPVQRCDMDYGVKLIRAAYEGGIRYFDTANSYTDSEEKLGLALADVRDQVVISTKSQARNKAGVLAHIENSLKMLRTDHIDLFQFHNVPEMPDPNDPDGAFAGALEAKNRGWIDHIGVTTHRVGVAEECIESGLFETLQFPFSYISSERDLALADKCKAAGMGFIAMKGLAGGLLTNARACHAFMKGYDNVVPIWGIQRMEELEKKDRQELAGSFCRSCGYCMPCPVGIEIRNCARMDRLLRRSPWKQYFTPAWQEKMNRIEDCLGCRQCASRCPYGLDTPNLLKYMLKDYRAFYAEHKDEL